MHQGSPGEDRRLQVGYPSEEAIALHAGRPFEPESLPREIDVRTAHGASLLRDYLESKKDDAPFARELRELLDHAGTIDDLERTLVTRREQIKAFRERSNEVRDELGHLDKVEASPLRKTLEQRLSDLDADPSKLTSEIVGLHEGLLATRTRFQDVLLCMTLVPELPHP